MVIEWLIEFIKGLAKICLHPLFYYSFFLAAFLGVSRVKRERKDFSIRLENAYFELKQLLPAGMIVGLGISIISVAIGITVPLAFLLFMTITTIILSLTTMIRLLSPVYTLGFAFFLLIFAGGENWEVPLFSDWFSQLNEKVYPSLAFLMVLLLLGEGILILINGKKGSSPKLVMSKRGLHVGIHEVKRTWLVPVFLFIPGQALEATFPWWPVFSIGTGTYSLILVPFLIGFHQEIQSKLPTEAVRGYGRMVITLSIPLLLLALGGLWNAWFSIATIIMGIIGREIIAIMQRVSDENGSFYFSKRNNGILILGIIPDSPASKMGLKVGEVITKVNGKLVLEEQSFYEAIQKNRAHCKLEVLDVFGRVRHVQRALYEGDHHELGIIFVEDKERWKAIQSL